jgi:transcriptional repressor NrdR
MAQGPHVAGHGAGPIDDLAMRCPFCSANDDRVVDSRESRDGATIRRRRECLACGRRFTSYEQIEAIPYLVVKVDGRREEFSRQKLLSGLKKACEKRPIPARKQEELVEHLEQQLHQREEREISTSEIGAVVMEQLRALDPVAYVRFASVYRRFEDIGSFVEEIQSLLNRPAAAEHARAEGQNLHGERLDDERLDGVSLGDERLDGVSLDDERAAGDLR